MQAPRLQRAEAGPGRAAPTFSHAAKGVLVGLVGHPAHHVRHAHALLVRGARGHGVPFWERGIARVGERVVHTDRTASEMRKRKA